GWLVGLPLTSAPVVFFLALDHGLNFAAATSIGILTGAISGAAFCLAYSRLAYYWHWPLTVSTSWLVFVAATWLLLPLTLPPIPLFLGLAALLVAILLLMPRAAAPVAVAATPWWDIPTRMLAATTVVLLLTALAPTLGPHLSGLLAPFPVFATILGVFTHHLRGPASAARLMRGVVLGMFAFASFFLVVAPLIQPAGLALTFAFASATALVIQLATLRLLQRARPTTPEDTKEVVAATR